MYKTKENNKGLTITSLVIVVIILMIISVITVTTIRKQNIMSRTTNMINDYNAMVTNKYSEMEGDKVLNMLELGD